jgi:hypothetical protein
MSRITYEPEPGVVATLNSINPEKLHEDLMKIQEDVSMVRDQIAGGIIYETIGYRPDHIIIDPKEQRKRELFLLDKIMINLHSLRYAAIINAEHRRMYLKSKRAHK